jgi:hypothetical protein
MFNQSLLLKVVMHQNLEYHFFNNYSNRSQVVKHDILWSMIEGESGFGVGSSLRSTPQELHIEK